MLVFRCLSSVICIHYNVMVNMVNVISYSDLECVAQCLKFHDLWPLAVSTDWCVSYIFRGVGPTAKL